jgi:hypothetical protein
MKDLGEEDRIFRERKAVLDLTRRNTPPAEYKNFCILMNFFDLSNILVELDSDSQISLVSESYFLEYLKPKMRLHNYTSEAPMTFKGLGSSITSKYPPLHLDFRVGGGSIIWPVSCIGETHNYPNIDWDRYIRDVLNALRTVVQK